MTTSIPIVKAKATAVRESERNLEMADAVMTSGSHGGGIRSNPPV